MMMKQKLRRIRWASWALVLVYLLSGGIATVSADNRTQTDIYSQNILYYDINSCNTNGANTNTTTITGQTATSGPAGWNSGVQPPYYLESFVINVLDDIAKVANVPTTTTVTQEHVVALVAWAWEEGGNIANTDLFNPWNTGIDDPSLLAGGASGDGVQSFKSFDAGVTAATLTMTGSNQNRLEQALTDQSSTAEQFMNALTYYQNYKGNQAWAGADVTDQQGYYNLLMQVLKQTRANYVQYANVELGNVPEGTHDTNAPLQYKNGGTSNPTGGSTTTTNSSDGCQTTMLSTATCTANPATATGTTTSSSSNSDSAIACQVLKYDTLSYSEAWHSTGAAFHQNCDATYKSLGKSPPVTVNGHAAGPLCATDCSGLVDIAVYDLFGTNISDTTFTIVTDPNFKEITNYSQLQPGDLIEPWADHVEIIEQVKGNTLDTFAAHTDNAPQPDQVGPATYTYSPGDGYRFFRYVGKGSTFAS